MILITRSHIYAQPIVDALCLWKEDVEVLPLLSIKEKVINKPLPLADILIFISQPSVEYFVNKYNIQSHQKIFAVGPATFAKLQSYSYEPEPLVAPYSSDGVLAHPVLQDVKGKKILIVCGKPFNDKIGKVMLLRGADVTYYPVYNRCLPKQDVVDKIKAFPFKDCKAIVFSSKFAMLNMYDIAKKYNICEFFNCPWIVISKSMYELAKGLGSNSHIILANNATNFAVIAVLKQLLQK